MWLEVFSKVLAMSEVQHQIVTGEGEDCCVQSTLFGKVFPQKENQLSCHSLSPKHVAHDSKGSFTITMRLAVGTKSNLNSNFVYAGGALIRGENDTRIDFLARVRNKALEPLWKLANESSNNSKNKAGLAVEPWKAERIIFMNDVFVCAKDFMRLILHEADMACGLDFGDRDKVSIICQLSNPKGGLYRRFGSRSCTFTLVENLQHAHN